MSARFLKRWFVARTKEPDRRFREGSIRTLLVVFAVFVFLSFVTSVVFFKSAWGLLSYQNAEIVAALLLVLSAIAVQRGKIAASGYFLVSAFVFFSTFTMVANTSAETAFGTSFIVTLVVAALVMPGSQQIFHFAGLSALLILVTFALRGELSSGSTVLSNVLITLGALSILLYRLRKEYDDKLMDAQAARRQTEQALQIAELKSQEAERANNAKSAFLSTMSHELRTPLGAIIGFTGILRTGMFKPKEEARELSSMQLGFLLEIDTNANGLLELINGLLDLTRIDEGRMQATLEPVNPCDASFIAGTVNSLRSLAIAKNLDLELRFDPALPASVSCDVAQVKQIVKNLVGNAIKFTDRGKVSVCVGSLPERRWQIVVEDTGIGIKPEALPHLFEKFYQADSSDTRSRQGSGLGLAIVRGFVDLHQGSVQVGSTPGSGSAFTVLLPQQP